MSPGRGRDAFRARLEDSGEGVKRDGARGVEVELGGFGFDDGEGVATEDLGIGERRQSRVAGEEASRDDAG